MNAADLPAAPAPRPRRAGRRAALLTAAALLGTPAGAVSIDGRLGNPGTVTQALGGSDLLVLLASFSDGRIVGTSPLTGGLFSLSIPNDFAPRLSPMNLCAGVKATPSEPRTYTAETLLVYQARRNVVATMTQADSATDPTRRTQWVYSDRAARIQGRCTGLNTRYSLTLRQGWNPVMTVSRSGDFQVTNATPGLPYWVQETFTSNARTVFGTLFDGR
ncbi:MULTISPECIES: hypothetical protein [Deinococcus]|uniref:Uncharacterized protein n=1 Tax=Deinococcus enclensis TaxID=1049582 RepID=A0ABT9MDF9_9DEIO|nr:MULTISPECIES: hypothetical protein [Deinococcus]MDP9764529.1 hypothetical protein [Deinococcus enclensis]